MENVDMFDFFEAISDFIMDPLNEEYNKRLEDFKSKLVIRSFLPLAQKEAVMLKTLYDINSMDTESQHFCSALEVSMTFNGLFAYVVNIDYNIEDQLKDEIYYDIFWASGVADYILSFCEKDYERLRDMIRMMISFENLKELLEEISKYTPESIDKLTESFKSFTLKANSDVIRNLADIARNNDPILTGVKENIIEGAWKHIDNMQKKQEAEEKAGQN